jgi:hypothetical protein
MRIPAIKTKTPIGHPRLTLRISPLQTASWLSRIGVGIVKISRERWALREKIGIWGMFALNEP